MRLGKAELVERGREVQLRTTVEMEGQKRHLWYGVEPRYGDYLTPERLDPFLVGLLIPAMMAGEDIRLEGPISEKLYWNLTHHYMRIMTSVIPTLRSVRILPAEVRPERPIQRPVGVATGFSGGIDSFCVLADHFYDETLPGHKVSHLVFNHVVADRALSRDRYERLRPAAEELGLPFIWIDSNLDDFYRIKHEQTHTPRNLSAVLSLQRLFGEYLYASGLRFEDCFVGPAHDTAYSDPFAVPLLSTETTECISSGSQYSRVQKTLRVSEVELSYRYLDVCTGRRGQGNCGVCWKCARTLLTLDLLDKTALYQRVFPIDRYRAAHRRCIAKVLAKNNPVTCEIVLLAKEKG